MHAVGRREAIAMGRGGMWVEPAVVKRQQERVVQVRNARASVTSARQLRGLASVLPQGVSEFVRAGVAQAADRAGIAAKRKLEDALAGRADQPRASSRGQRMAAIAAAAAVEGSIL